MATKKFKCKVCGYIHEGDAAPAKCPVCGAPASEFEEIVEAGAGDAGAKKGGLFSDKNSNAYIILYSTVMVVIVAVLLSLAALSLQKRQYANELGEKKNNILQSLGVPDGDFDAMVKAYVVDAAGNKTEKPAEEVACTADLDVTANIDKQYVPSGEQRMDLYRRMAAIRTKEDADELLDEIVDRFGDPPKGVMNLIAIALLRARAAAAGITEITQKDGAILLSLATMDFAAISACCAEAQFKGRIFFSAGKVPMLSVKLKKGEDALKLATQLVGTYAAMRAQTAEG